LATLAQEYETLCDNRSTVDPRRCLAVAWAVNPLTPNDHYSGRTAPLTSKVAFYILIQQI